MCRLHTWVMRDIMSLPGNPHMRTGAAVVAPGLARPNGTADGCPATYEGGTCGTPDINAGMRCAYTHMRGVAGDLPESLLKTGCMPGATALGVVKPM